MEESLEKVIDKIENVCKGMAVLISALPNEKGYNCAIKVFADSAEMVEDVYSQIESKTIDTE